MMLLKEWLKTIPKNMSDEYLAEVYFHRDPIRPHQQDKRYFFAPADGIVLYAIKCSEKGQLFDIKGKQFTLRDLLEIDIALPAIVVGIFMTKNDVHVNRIPYSGYLRYWELEPIKTKNYPMLDEEKDLLKGVIKHDDMDYLFYNERVINKVTSDIGPYYIVQVADYDVDVITPFNIKQSQPVIQCERFSMIRFGSQVDLVIPIVGHKYKILTKPLEHLEAGLDPIVEVLK